MIYATSDCTDHANFCLSLADDLRDDLPATAGDLILAAEMIKHLAAENTSFAEELEAHEARTKAAPAIADVMTVWEHFADDSEARAKLPVAGVGEAREYVANTLTAFCDMHFEFITAFFPYDIAYDCGFTDVFLSELPHHDVATLTNAELKTALDACLAGNSGVRL